MLSTELGHVINKVNVLRGAIERLGPLSSKSYISWECHGLWANCYCESLSHSCHRFNQEPYMRRGTKRSRTSLANGKGLTAAGETFHHSVYVILLDPAVLRHPSILRSNPKRDPAKPCVYVGMTGLLVQDRFENHKKGQKSAWVVKKYGLRLMPELYEYLNLMPFEAAAQMEKDLAEDLRAEGYTVAGGT